MSDSARPSRFQPHYGGQSQPQPRSVEILYETSLNVERKNISLSLRQNSRGRFLRITEEVAGRRDAIVVPASGLEAFREALDSILTADSANPAEEPMPEE